MGNSGFFRFILKCSCGPAILIGLALIASILGITSQTDVYLFKIPLIVCMLLVFVFFLLPSAKKTRSSEGTDSKATGLSKAADNIIILFSGFLSPVVVYLISLFATGFESIGKSDLFSDSVFVIIVIPFISTVLFSLLLRTFLPALPGRANKNEKREKAGQADNGWHDFEEKTADQVNENWKTYLQRARQEDIAGGAAAGNNSLDQLLHHFLWCVHDLSKHAFGCQGTITVRPEGNAYSIQAYVHPGIDDSQKYQTLYRAMTESFFIETPGIRLDFSDSRKDTDHSGSFPWVSKNHSAMIPTTDYYITGMRFSVSDIQSLTDHSFSSFYNTPEAVLKKNADQADRFYGGLSCTIYRPDDEAIRMDFTMHYAEPKVAD